MRKQDLKKDASSFSLLASTMACMLSALAIVAYFMFRSTSPPKTAVVVSTTENYCQKDFENEEALLDWLSDLKTELGDEWTSLCQD